MNHSMTMPMGQPTNYIWLIALVLVIIVFIFVRFARLRQLGLVALMVLLPLHMLFSSDMALGSGVTPAVAMHMDNHPCCAPRVDGSPIVAPQPTLIWIDRYPTSVPMHTKLGWHDTLSNKAPPLV